jgi:hypothetical protein
MNGAVAAGVAGYIVAARWSCRELSREEHLIRNGLQSRSCILRQKSFVIGFAYITNHVDNIYGGAVR